MQQAQWQSLEDALADRLDGEVRFSDGDRALYATDASNYRQVPRGVVVPRHVDDIVDTVRLAHEHDLPLLMRGGGTSLAGQCCNDGLVIDTSKYVHGVLDIDEERRTARVLPGTYLDDLRDTAEEHGLTFGPDPATHNHCTIGGMIGNDSCGVHSMMSEFYGAGARTSQNVESLDVITYDGVRLRTGATEPAELERRARDDGRAGELYSGVRALVARHGPAIRERFPDIQRRVSGYNLPALLPENGSNLAQALVGSESTCAVVLEATVRLLPAPGARVLLVLGYPSVYEAADAVPTIREHQPIGLEGMDDVLVGYVRSKKLHPEKVDLLPEGGGWMLVDFGGDTVEEASGRARGLLDALERSGAHPSHRLFKDPEDQHSVWQVRESGLGATAFVPGEHDTWPGWEDAAVPPDRIGDYLRDFRALLERFQYECALYGHFGQGCVHTRIDFDLRTSDGVARYRDFTREAADLVIGYGGSLSGEHGDGQARGDLLERMYGADMMDAFRSFKRLWDPAGRMNPGKVIDAHPRTADLRIGPEYAPQEPDTRFAYPDDNGSFAHATLRCVGVGECRKESGGVMCPSYMALREEKHTTRGRAHLLNEMLRGDVVRGGWRDEDVKDSLDLCLACKGCTGECPVEVDIPTYKAEFLSHYYDGRLRPRAAYAFGLIDVWARLASHAPRLANFMTGTPVLGRVVKAVGGVAPDREIPQFARRTFRERFEPSDQRADGTPVILWPDTFNNHFQPAVLHAGARLLEHAGYRVTLPPAGLCCGRPLYDWGMLDRAERYLRDVLSALGPALDAGARVVGLEPSCVAVFRDELPKLMPDDDGAARLTAAACTLGELLQDADVSLPEIGDDVLVHAHCHHRAVLDLDADLQLLRSAAPQTTVLDSGCCGMAGAFGFESEKYDVSMAVGERVLLPSVRDAGEGCVIVSDGFSCREQISQGTNRRALHTAEVLAARLGTRRNGEMD